MAGIYKFYDETEYVKIEEYSGLTLAKSSSYRKGLLFIRLNSNKITIYTTEDMKSSSRVLDINYDTDDINLVSSNVEDLYNQLSELFKDNLGSGGSTIVGFSTELKQDVIISQLDTVNANLDSILVDTNEVVVNQDEQTVLLTGIKADLDTLLTYYPITITVPPITLEEVGEPFAIDSFNNHFDCDNESIVYATILIRKKVSSTKRIRITSYTGISETNDDFLMSLYYNPDLYTSSGNPVTLTWNDVPGSINTEYALAYNPNPVLKPLIANNNSRKIDSVYINRDTTGIKDHKGNIVMLNDLDVVAIGISPLGNQLDVQVSLNFTELI